MTPAEFDDLAKLARLALTPAEKETLRHQMEVILGYVKKLEEVDIGGAEHTITVPRALAPPREDTPANTLPTSDALAQAPKKAWDFFAVPQILED